MNASVRIARPKVLIVEDQYLLAIECERHLEAAGFRCVGLASTAADAILLAAREHPDLILMDIRLASRTGGVEAAQEIFDTYGIRSVFMSAHGDAETRRLAAAANPLGWLPKPYTPTDLLDVVKAAANELSSTGDGQLAPHRPTADPRSDERPGG
jgi:DNA-binding NarL/FixJ family response regulator